MFEIKHEIKENLEKKIGETIKDGKDILECIEQTEESGADGSFCYECFYHFVTPSQCRLIGGCGLPDYVIPHCTSGEREDGINIIFRKK